MIRKMISGVLLVSAFVFISEVFAGDVTLTTYYPMPEANYKTLNSTGQSSFATSNAAGQSVGFGTAAPANIAANDAGGPNTDLAITGSIVQEGWTNVGTPGAPVFQSGWQNRGNRLNPAGYFRDKSGIVHLRGLVMGGAAPSVIFNLPAGYQPLARELRIVVTRQASMDIAGRCDIAADGNVIAQRAGFTPDTPNKGFSLDGITFRANGY